MTRSTEHPRFSITLEAVPDSAPAEIRLRRFLKAALRSYGLKCVDVVEVRSNQRGGKGGVLLPQNSAQARVETRKEVAASAGVSHDTIANAPAARPEAAAAGIVEDGR